MDVLIRRGLGLAALIGAMALPAGAQAETFTRGGGGSITIADRASTSSQVGLGTPYPSTMKVEGGDGDIIDVNVHVTLSHTFPDDIDLAIVSPEGNAEVLMSDVCLGDALVNDAFTFDQDASTGLPDDSQPPPCTSGGTFRPTDADFQESSDIWPSPGPGSISTANLDSFTGENPNGEWKLYVVDDYPGHVGSIASWGLTIETQNSTVVMPAGPATSGPANPYPSVKTFNLPAGHVTSDVDFDALGFHHQHPDDIDMLLQAPTGQAVMIMSDACGGDDILTGITWIFTEQAVSHLHDSNLSSCLGAAYRPTDYDPGETLPSPAPAGPYANTLHELEGLQGGSWRLFVNDDASGDTGYLDNWNLVLTTRPAAPTALESNVAVSEGETATLTVTRSGAGIALGPATVAVAVEPEDADASDFVAPPSQLVFARTEATKTIEIPITDDTTKEGAEIFAVQLSNPVNDVALTDSRTRVKILGSDQTDDVQPGPPPEPPANEFGFGDVQRKANGSGQVEVIVPGPGTLTADDATTQKLGKAAAKKNLLKLTNVSVAQAGTAILPLKPAKQAKRKLKRGKKVKVLAAITYTPAGGAPNTANLKVKLKRKP